MLTEGIVLSCGGAALGFIIAIVGTRGLARLEAVSIPLLREVHADRSVLLFTIAVAILTGIIFGLAPALQTRGAALTNALKDATRGSTEGRRSTWIRNTLVVSEIAFACVLLVGAGLLIRSLIHVLDVDMGFDPARAVTVRVDPDRSYDTRQKRNAYLDEVLRRVGEIPGVEGAGVTDALPLGRNRTWGARAKGVTYERGRAPMAFVRIVSDGYFKAMGIPLVAGRDIAPSDSATSGRKIVINETMARTLWPNEDPIGKFVLNACAPEAQVVGVVRDVRHIALEQTAGNEMYIAMRQCGDVPSSDLVVRSSLSPTAAAGAIKSALQPLAPNLTNADFRTLQQLVDKSVSPRRFMVLLLAGFAVFALILASLGIYALISYSVSQRTQEIGIRMALGASARDVQSRIITQTLILAAVGMVFGAIGSWALARGAGGLLFNVTPSDPGTFVGMMIVLMGVAAIAGYLPARRASRIDPMVALRSE
jgi:predicted permease